MENSFFLLTAPNNSNPSNRMLFQNRIWTTIIPFSLMCFTNHFICIVGIMTTSCYLILVLIWLLGCYWRVLSGKRKQRTWKLNLELQQCYKAQSQLSEQLAMEFQQSYKAQSQLSDHLAAELSESRASKALLQEKENAIADMQKELTKLRFHDVSLLFIYFISLWKTIVALN